MAAFRPCQIFLNPIKIDDLVTLEHAAVFARADQEQVVIPFVERRGIGHKNSLTFVSSLNQNALANIFD
jgi:hypothetical protein